MSSLDQQTHHGSLPSTHSNEPVFIDLAATYHPSELVTGSPHPPSLGVSVNESGVPHERNCPEHLTTDEILHHAAMHQAPYGTVEPDEKNDEEVEMKSISGDHDNESLGNKSFLSLSMAHGGFDDEVVRIARQMKGLDERQFLMLADLTQKRAWRNVYSLVDYHGTNWYLPNIRPVEGDEARFGAGVDGRRAVWFSLFGWRVELNVLGYLIRAIILVALWLTLWSAMPQKLVELRGFVFDPILLVITCTIVGGFVSRVFRIPPLVCVLWIGIMWNNIPTVGYLTSGINPYVRKASNTIGLCSILIRAGLYIKLEELKPMALKFVAFAYLPVTAELVSHSFMAKAMFGYPTTAWAFAHGAVAAAVSPGVVVPAVLNLKLDGIWVTRGPGTLLMPAAPAEMVVAIWNITFMANLVVSNGEWPTWLNALLGPVQFVGGILLGIILGFVHFGALKVFLAEAHKLPHRQYTVEHASRVSYMSTFLLVLLGLATLFYTKSVHLYGGGSIAVVLMAMTTAALQRRRSDTSYFADQAKYLSIHTADLWDHIAMPLLFSMVGSSIDLSQIFNSYFFPRMLACIAVGLSARIILVLLVTLREDYDIGERLVMAVGWCGKATVQAALARTALDQATEIYSEVAQRDGLAAANENMRLAKMIANAGVLMISLCAPLGALVLVRLGPKVARMEATPGVGGGH